MEKTVQDRLKELFDYDPTTGWFINRFSRGAAGKGSRAGSTSGHGYRKLTVDYERIYEHQAVWLYVHGYVPTEIDHINGNGADNRLSNLRPCDRTQNNANSSKPHPLRGAYYHTRMGVWYSKIQVHGKVIFLGNHATAEKAHKAFEAAHQKHHGEFSAPVNP